ncbi:OmpA family protein [Parasphingorhabdus sp.]|uniref:OmpA family protein n=1 Tax=Parasphingorhabdus sp. TaxID=2709688 RepID=UPI00326675A4
MEVGGKILTGAAATALLALVGHAISGESYISGLEESVNTELAAQGVEGVTASFSRDPLSRRATLDGDVRDEIKQKALGTVSAIAGVSRANWKGAAPLAASGGGAPALTSNDGANACQASVDNAIAGEKLNFRSGSAYVSPASNKIIDSVAAALKTCSDFSVAIGGHTDSNGNAEINKSMSQERADRVRSGLIERGISESQVTATGYGSEQPLAEGSGPEADARNRRIEFKVSTSGNDANAQQGK